MGIDYSVRLAVGYVLGRDQVLGPFMIYTEERAHMEDRFDPRSGKKLLPQKVVDEAARNRIMIDGVEKDDYEAIDDVCALLGPGVSYEERDHGDDVQYVIGLRRPPGYKDVDVDWGHVSATGEFVLPELAALMVPDYLNLSRRIREVLGCEPGPLLVTLAWHVG